jgi:hypothetical protein
MIPGRRDGRPGAATAGGAARRRAPASGFGTDLPGYADPGPTSTAAMVIVSADADHAASAAYRWSRRSGPAGGVAGRLGSGPATYEEVRGVSAGAERGASAGRPGPAVSRVTPCSGSITAATIGARPFH